MDLTGSSRRAPHRRWGGLLAALVTAAVVVGVLVGVSAAHREVLATGTGADFFDRQVTWAQGSTLHYGDRDFDVAPLVVHAVRPTRHGVFLRVSDTDAFDAPTRWVLFDGTTTTGVPGDVDDVAVAPDGEHAGWIDRDGPWRPAGRVAKVVVVDLRTGKTEFETTSGMGGGFGDDLGSRYENLPPTFLGFDEGSAYWLNATGSGERWRWHRATGRTERAEGSDPYADADTTPVGAPWNPQRGPEVWIEDGRPVPEPAPAGERGFLSPDGRFVISEPVARLVVTRAGDGARVHVDLDRFAWFGGWQDDRRFYALTRTRYEDGFDPAKPDRTEGALMSCALPSGACTRVVEVAGTRSVVLPGAGDRELLL